jgi:hypothetical protein
MISVPSQLDEGTTEQWTAVYHYRLRQARMNIATKGEAHPRTRWKELLFKFPVQEKAILALAMMA